MLIPEIILGIILTFGLGSFVGIEQGKKQAVKQEIEITVWPPSEHVKLMKTCGYVCGERRVKSYSAAYGKCVCSNKYKKRRR